MVNTVTAAEVAQQIQPGVIYLTKGTTQQIQSLLPDDVAVESHYNPTTKVFRQWLIPNPLDNEVKAKIIFYPKLEGTGRIKETKTKGEAAYGSVKSKNPYALPTDQALRLPKGIYFFILLTDPVTGEVNKVNAKANLQGDYIEELDLRHVIFSEESEVANSYPITAKKWEPVVDPLLLEMYPTDLSKPEDSDYFISANLLIKQLLEDKAAKYWYDLGQRGEYYKWFLVDVALYKEEEKKMPVILTAGRAWGLYPYLEFFLDSVKENHKTAPLQLSKFATWVNLTTKVYAAPGFGGLYWCEQRGKRKGYWKFQPSAQARMLLPLFLNER